MSPSLVSGQEVVATGSVPPTPGDVVAFEHPERTGHWLIKRLSDGNGWVVSDNAADSSADSRELGPVPMDRLLTVVDQLDTTTFSEACELLASEDQSFEGLVGRWGVPAFWHREPGFPTLVLLILEQQVSLESGAAMYKRLATLLSGVSAKSLLAAGADELRSIGVTRQKSGYLTGLAAEVASGNLDLSAMADATDEQARNELVSVKGIGPWTADAYLLSALRRLDIWPVGDRALQVGAGEMLGMDGPPDEAELEMIGEPWRPVRAVAARLIWHAYLSRRGRVEPPDPTLVHTTRTDA